MRGCLRAPELGEIASRIGAGRRVVIKDGPWRKDNILKTISNDE